MPTYEAELSDGRIVTVQADKPPSEADILAAIGKQNAPAVDALTPEGIPRFNPKRDLAPPTEEDTEFAEGQAHPLTTPIAKILPRLPEELIGRAASFLPSIARDWYEALPETRKSPDKPIKPSLKEKALYAIAGATPSDKAISIATGVQNAGADIGNFFTSPTGIATLGIGSLPAAAQRAVAIGFAATMAKDVPEIATELGTELGKPEDQRDYRKISELTAQGIANTGFAAAGVAHGAGKPLADKFGAYPNESVTSPVTQEKGTENAEAIRANQGQIPAQGQEPQNGQETSGNDVQQPPPGQPEPVVEGEPQTTPNIPNEVAPGNREAAADQTMHSMGGLAPSDPMEEAGRGEGNPDVYGIAQRVREQRALAGQVAEVPIGEGISTPDSIERGRELLKQDPTLADKSMTAFEADPKKAISADAMALARAKGEELAQISRRTEEQFGTESAEYKAAWKALSDWDARSKPMQTEWNKIGMAQQGETDIDTGSFTGLQRAFKDASGKEFKPEQARAAKQKAAVVSKAAETTTAAKQKVFEAIEDQSRNASKSQLKLDEQDKAAKRALAAANKTVRDAAASAAESENKARVAAEALKSAVERVQEKADARAQKAADKTITQAGIRAAREENKARVREAAEKKAQAEKERIDAQKKLLRAQAEVRKAAIAAARAESANRVNPERIAWRKAKDYIDKGLDNFDEIRNKIATDLGISVDYATKLLAYSKRAKFLADDLWRKQQAERRLRQQAKQWLDGLDVPFYKKAIASVPKILFSLKVGFHGTVALGTHAPMVAFQPRFWESYVRDFGKMYKMVGSKAYYERQVQDLLRRPNYTVARRAGLVNDPFTYEDFNSPETSKYFGKVTGMGNRGYSVLKILRQDMFDQMWSKLPRTAQVPEVAEAIADGLNHATGVIKGAAPKGANTLLFAPRLLASRVMWLAVDPIKAAETFARWKDAGPGEKRFAINQIKEKAWVAGTLFAMLAINQGLLTAMDSDQKVNLTDPFKGDFLKFKVAGMTLAYGNAMLTMARLPVRLFKIRESDGGKLKNLVYPDEDTYTVLGEYGRSQLSPFASLALDLWLKSDWQRRPLPNSNRPVPKRLREKGEIPYTWPEFWSEQVLPIPAEEAAREVWRHGLGMSDDQIKAIRKALATISVMSATGARLTEDTDVRH